MYRKIVGILVCMLFLVAGIIASPFIELVNAGPTIENITTNPVKPKSLSTFTIIATITGENINSVTVTISECTEKPTEQCFVTHTNIPMTLNDNGKYEAEVTLTGTQKSIDHIQYLFVINDNGTEYQIGGFKTYLDIEPNLQNNAFIFGRINNLRSDGDSITFNAVDIKVIVIAPFSFIHYSTGEYFEISKDYTGFIGVNFIFALVYKNILKTLNIMVSKSPIYQGETLTVTVLSEEARVEDVTVTFGTTTALTDANGEVDFTVPDPGVESAIYIIRAEKEGYITAEIAITVIKLP